MKWNRMPVVILIVLMILIVQACAGSPTSSPTSVSPSPSPTPTTIYSQYQLEYQLLARYPDYFWCDPDIYPVARQGQEETNAQQQFPDIQANGGEFSAILEHLGLPVKADYTDAEKLSIYREHKLLTHAVTLTPAEKIYDFSIRTGQNQGLSISGTISAAGQITVLKQSPSFNTCPICLTQGTLIDTPNGPVPVEKLQPGMVVWTRNTSGNRVVVPILKVSATPVPSSFLAVKVTLEDGRSVTASPGHPTADLKALASYRVGNILDGSRISEVARLTYDGGYTYDLLPSGVTGLYWANGILLETTLTK